ncbi:MAG: glycosyltransferase [Chthoniobacterales bacterium]
MADSTSPKISVCLDSYNYGRFLPEAIESVLSQTFADFEVIICDDCSSDDSHEIARRYALKDQRVKARRNSENLGMIKNRNACLARARGEYVKWLHADDFLCSKHALATMVSALDQNAAVSLVASARQIVDETSKPSDIWSCFEQRPRPISGTGVITRCLFEQRNLIGGPSAVMFRRSLAARGFDEAFFVMADLEMWFHLLEQGCFFYIEEPLCAIREHSHQQTQRDKTSLAPALENRDLLRRYLPKRYVELRRWNRKYLEYDAVRRIVRRSRKIGTGREQAAAAVDERGGWAVYRRQALRHGYHQALLKIRRLHDRHLRRSLGRATGKTALPGINMVGFSQSVYGIGESTRAMWRAVQATGIPCVLLNVRSRVHSNRDVTFKAFARHNPFAVNLMTFSFDYSRRFYRDMGPRFFAGRRNIGLWYWEQERFPLTWHSSFDYYDEIWVPTEFTRRAIAAVSPIPVRKITYPFYLPEDDTVADRPRFGLDHRDYVFLFTFDFFSTIERKNPAAVIAAFRAAFRQKEPAVLVIKSINCEHHRAVRESLERDTEGAKVVFMDSHMTPAEISALFASADCYVSLHRSEGFGLGMAQAMYLGKPVVATNYSGNLEFMNEQNSLLVDFTMTELQEHSGPYERGTIWAEPNIEHAAALMRFVYDRRDESEAIGKRAAASIRSILNPAVTANQIREYIDESAAPNRG